MIWFLCCHPHCLFGCVNKEFKTIGSLDQKIFCSEHSSIFWKFLGYVCWFRKNWIFFWGRCTYCCWLCQGILWSNNNILFNHVLVAACSTLLFIVLDIITSILSESCPPLQYLHLAAMLFWKHVVSMLLSVCSYYLHLFVPILS